MDFQAINDGVNGALDTVFDNPYLSGIMKLSLVMFGSLAAPKITPKFGYLFANSYFRILVMILIIWTYNRDPALSIIIAVSYFMIMEHVMKNAVKEVAATGIITPAIANILSGGSSLQTSDTQMAAKNDLQNVIGASKAAGFITSVPEAVMSSSSSVQADAPPQPSGVPATATTMIAEGSGGAPEAYTPDGVASLAEAPK